ncbi:putrescine aminopropyltransferase [Thoreauomyces humboldtii]|nr:putrescine aminopropyltransferase [Thoreauomyces humboldtii]
MSGTHPNIQDGWFKETTTLWPGQAMTLQVKEILHHEKSLFQDVLVFQSTNHGNVLVLDGVIQATERDEFAYQEMIAHLPLNAHPEPKKVLVIGGGDGGVLREIVKHPSIQSVTLVEIDEAVPRASKKFLPAMAVGFQHPKVKLVIGDGFAFLEGHKKEFDVIITDSSDPVGPAESLFGEKFYEMMKDALVDGGVVCTQGECQWLHLPLIRDVLQSARRIFPVVEYAYASVPTYPCGQIGFVLASNDPSMRLKAPHPTREAAAAARAVDQTRQVDPAKLKYYNSEVHRASFVLPQFAKVALAPQ